MIGVSFLIMNREKINEYTVKVLDALNEVFKESNGSYIDLKEVDKTGTCNELIYALSAIAPAIAYEKITGVQIDALAFNHVVNTLIVQNLTDNNAL